MEEADESGMDEFSTFGDEDVGGTFSVATKGGRYSCKDEVDRN